ncbi:MAG: ATP-binding protein [Rikenellaceae bacterium]
MIKGFSVENFLSFKERQEVSFEATSDKQSEASLVYKIIHPQSGSLTRILRMSFIYGANASGKTNLLFAIKSIFQLLSQYTAKKEESLNYVPFAMIYGEPTKSEISFFIDNIEYQYIVEYNKSIILKEVMKFNPKGVMSSLYTRIYDVERNMPIITFGDNANIEAKAKKVIIENTFNNNTVISTFGKKSIYAPSIEVVYNWAHRGLENSSRAPHADIKEIASTIVNMLKDNSKRDFLIKYINAADFNISDVKFEEKNIDMPESFKSIIIEDDDLSEEQKSKLLNTKEIKIEVEHSADGRPFTLPLNMESNGTLKTIGLSDTIYKAMTCDEIFAIDEVDDALHYDLIAYILQVLLVNEHSSQLIFTTHNQRLLDEDFVRRDMVWFTEKNQTTASTEVYSAVEFKLHKNISLYNAYKVGKLGAIPELGSPFVKISNK